ncbi:MAG: hypothetical protein WC875_04240 [Candidatus Absconditabacterales bacterium]|jgi:hypothetical protein
MTIKKLKKLLVAFNNLVGPDYNKSIVYMVGPKGAFTILIECVNAIPKDNSSFSRLEKFIMLMSLFEENSLHFLKKAEAFYTHKQSIEIAACMQRFIVLLQCCGLDKYKHKEHKTFIKYDGRVLLLLSRYRHFPETISFFEKQQKSATGIDSYSVKDFDLEVQGFLQGQINILQDDYARLQSLFPQKIKGKKGKKAKKKK